MRKLSDIIKLYNGESPKGLNSGKYKIYGSNGVIGSADRFLYSNSIIIGRVGAYCGSIMYERHSYWATDNTIVADVKNNDDIVFIYYLLKYLNINNCAIGSAQPLITQGLIYDIEINIPDINTQKKIAGVLAAFDELIEVNRRKIKILEEMAQAVYNQWFVKMRFPGHEKFALPIGSGDGNAPYRVFDSPLGPLPEGWEVMDVNSIAYESRSSVNPKSIQPDTPYVGLEHIPRESLFLNDFGIASDVESLKLAFVEGDILFGKIRPYFHKVVISHIKGICSTDTIVIKPKEHNYRNLILFTIFSKDFVNLASQTSQGTKMPRANWEVISKYSISVAPQRILENFNSLVDQFIKTGQLLVKINWNLSSLRDLLLPKLISGKMDVSELDIDQYALGEG